MGSLFRWLSSLAVVLGALLLPRVVLADDAAARVHFKRGIELYDKKQFAEALAAFEDAYREKPTATIKQNIGLSLKGLGKVPEAATAFDEALDEGKSSLKPDTRAAIERELAELAKQVATVRLAAIASEKKTQVDPVTITITPEGGPAKTLPPGAHYRPIRLAPGTYVFSARAPGFSDPGDKHLALLAGAPVDATFLFQRVPSTPMGTLVVKASVPDATIKIDGVEVAARGTWSGMVPPGTHKVEVSASGWKTTYVEVTVSDGATVDFPVRLLAIGEMPPEYVAPASKAAKKRGAYIAVSGALDGGSYRLSDELGEPVGGTRRSFVGLALAGRFGYHVTQKLALDLHLEAGAMGSKYELRPGDANDTETTVVHWQATPGLRFVGPGAMRFTGGMGLGVHGTAVETELAARRKEGSGVAFSFLMDAGFQAEVGPVFFEALLFLNVHGIGPVRDAELPHERLLLASPGARAGIRLGVGIPF